MLSADSIHFPHNLHPVDPDPSPHTFLLQAFFTQATVVNPKVEKARTRIVDFDSSSDDDEGKVTKS